MRAFKELHDPFFVQFYLVLSSNFSTLSSKLERALVSIRLPS